MTNELQFNPATINIRVGDTVTWQNSSELVHTVTDDPALAQDPANSVLPPGAQAWDSGDLAPGQSYTKTFTVPGEYRYFCRPHEAAGMVGTIVVSQ